MDVYLDFNISLSIIKKEINNHINYEYILSKLHQLHRNRQDIQFPYSPAHMEEVAVNLKKDNDARKLIVNRLKIIEYYSREYEYLPGVPLKTDIIQKLRQLPLLPELITTRRNLEHILELYESGRLEENPATVKTYENPIKCFNRVISDLNATDFAHKLDIFYLGRRNKESLQRNFNSIQEDYNNIETFIEFQKKYKLGSRRLSNIDPTEIFKIENVQLALEEFLTEANEYNLTKGSKLLLNHTLLEGTVTLILNFLEKIGYNQEENNKVVKLRSRMHDVTHAIYGSQADYFVTNDVRFRNKLKATYNYLDITCTILSPEEFIRNSFEEKYLDVIVL